MSTIITLRVPASAFALDDVLSRNPIVEAQPVRSVQLDGATLSPLLWLRSDDSTPVEPSLRDDPSVREISPVAPSTDGGIYRLGLDPLTDEFMRLFADDSLTVLGAYGRDGEWVVRVLASDRNALSSLVDQWRRAGQRFDVERIVSPENLANPMRFGLTDSQYHTLVTAFRHGYYGVPRDSTITELSNIFGISHQAISQRLRRGHEQLIRRALIQRPSLSLQY
ncbi:MULTISPECIES: helix-turn-helix domain-containing protein [Haloferax]|uniref:HTH DNA binding domain protein n=1 Tax=Haloferax massiliensis TaxID=1476858 RepID=A0A0D6JVM9_9EURY|nr:MULTISPECIES: helix-turn-helix domain-containing protein [Haloferax]MDS0242227.1 helix-turn-helix domain-containing protein [Haloferax sp. S2CR25]MDS0445348.1 helix-turn-helix domain-containing protein [Haloferax sp. S2CR25-2]CQR53001.1 HTH DNA binding domain protein [Haloferax massiliensis]